VILFVVLGVAQWVGGGVVGAITGANAPTRAEALSAVTAAHNTLTGRIQQFRQQVAACGSAADRLSCVESADAQLADAAETFASQVDALEFPASAQDEAAEMVRVGHDFASVTGKLAAAPSPAEYTRLAADVDRLGNLFDQRYRALVGALAS
jgi:hypothetical protein